MNQLLLFITILVIFSYFGGSNVPKVLKDNKQMLLGVVIGLVLPSVGVNIEGNGNKKKKGEGYEEKDEGFTCGIDITSDEKYFLISTSDHTTSEIYFFGVNEVNPKPKLFKKRQKDIKY